MPEVSFLGAHSFLRVGRYPPYREIFSVRGFDERMCFFKRTTFKEGGFLWGDFEFAGQ
jgi:hypothetical protein